MEKREISNLDLKIKLTKEYLDNCGLQRIVFPNLLRALADIKFDTNGKAAPDTVSPTAKWKPCNTRLPFI